MAETKYSYSIANDFPNQKVNTDTLSYEISESVIVHALDRINTEGDACDLWFKDELDMIDSTAMLPSIIASHQGNAIIEPTPPTTADGKPIVRADSRPLETETYFTMAGDSTAIGDGKLLMWDFSNDDDEYVDSNFIPPGYKAKKLTLNFHCPVYLKDGTIYFFDAPWGCYVSMFIGVPQGSYFPNPAGSIPASALGLSDGKMYDYASDGIVPYQAYVMRHHMCGTCQMGDELNAEGAAINPIPVGWNLCGLIVTPDSDVTSKGYASLEMYRCHTMLLPGETIESIHS